MNLENTPNTRDWYGKWIEPVQTDIEPESKFNLKEMFSGKKIELEPVETRLHPPKLMKKVFKVMEKEIKKAELVMTSRGMYQVKINGCPVTSAIFTPDFTAYTKLLMYQTYEITDLLHLGENTWTVVLADGWYGGRVSTEGASAQFGNRLAILGDLTIEYSDGTKAYFGTDDSFHSSVGKYIYSDLFIGEKQDLRRYDENWEKSTDFNDYEPVILANYTYDNLVPQYGPFVKEMEFLPLKEVWWEDDAVILDFGQVISGYVRLNLFLENNQEISLVHSEVLDENGKFLQNIQGINKDQTEKYIGRGKKDILKPDFTFHGFRYVKLSGYQTLPTKEEAQAIVVYSDMEHTGELRTSNPLLNKLMENIKWSQKGNMVSIPSDCPQREKMGWSGDNQVFAPTGTFFMDIKDFFMRWLDSLVCDQQENGEIINYSPAPKDYYNCINFIGTLSSAGWGDAIVMIPWELYKKYDDKNILERYYEAMVKWHEFSKRSAAGSKIGDARYIWDTKFHFGDWMLPSIMMGSDFKGPMETAKPTKEVMATAYLAHTSELLANVAKVLEKPEATEFLNYSKNVKRVFNQHFMKKKGRFEADFQGPYTVALAFKLLSEVNQKLAIKRLVELIEANGNRLDTGFLSINYLLDVLCDYGHKDLALKVFHQDRCPSWFYEIKKGATTIWESWAAIKPDGTVGKYSFNHFAYGCVGDWIVRKIGGLELKKPGFKEFYATPFFDPS